MYHDVRYLSVPFARPKVASAQSVTGTREPTHYLQWEFPQNMFLKIYGSAPTLASFAAEASMSAKCKDLADTYH